MAEKKEVNHQSMEMYHNDDGNGHVSQRGRDYITSVDEQIFDSSVQI